MKRAVVMSKKLYVLEIEDIESDLENIEGFAGSGEPVIIFDNMNDIEELRDYFVDWHDEDTIIHVGTEEDEE